MGPNGDNQSSKDGDSAVPRKCSLVLQSIPSPGTHFVSLPPTPDIPGLQPSTAVDDPEKPSEDKPEFALESDPWHQLRQVLAGVLALIAGLYDAWIMGSARGFDISFDTVLVLTGLYLISGASSLMSLTKSRPSAGPK